MSLKEKQLQQFLEVPVVRLRDLSSFRSMINFAISGSFYGSCRTWPWMQRYLSRLNSKHDFVSSCFCTRLLLLPRLRLHLQCDHGWAACFWVFVSPCVCLVPQPGSSDSSVQPRTGATAPVLPHRWRPGRVCVGACAPSSRYSNSAAGALQKKLVPL